jgi:hypothetical protein
LGADFQKIVELVSGIWIRHLKYTRGGVSNPVAVSGVWFRIFCEGVSRMSVSIGLGLWDKREKWGELAMHG